MRQLSIVLLILVTISCSKTKQADNFDADFKLDVDSIFVASFSTTGLTKIEMPSSFLATDDQKFFPAESIIFYEFRTQKISDTVVLKIILAKPAYVAVFEGELKIVFLVTFDQNGHIIDRVRVGKTQGAAEYYSIETSEIEDNFVKRKSDESTYEEDSISGGSRVHKIKNEIFKITSDGKIKRQPTKAL